MSLVVLNGVTVSYLDVGEGPTVLMLHGWTADGGDWIHQVPALVDAGYRVVIPDLMGHGGTQAVPSGDDLLSSADRAIALLDGLDVERAIVVGHSFGGVIAVVLATEHAGRCDALVLVDPALGREPHVVDAMAGGLLSAIRSNAAGEAIGAMISGLHAPTSRPDLVAWHRRRAAAVPVEVGRSILGAMLDDPRSSLRRERAEVSLATIVAPTLVVNAASSASQCDWERACLKNEASRVEGWSDVGHWLQLEKPDRFNALLLAWLESVG